LEFWGLQFVLFFLVCKRRECCSCLVCIRRVLMCEWFPYKLVGDGPDWPFCFSDGVSLDRWLWRIGFGFGCDENPLLPLHSYPFAR
jgi:hypothetical protein